MKYLLIAVGLTCLASCYYDKEANLYPSTPCDSASVSYATVMKPKVFDVFCNNSGCHNTATKAGTIALDNLADAVSAVKNNNLLCCINHTGCSNMPKGGVKLNNCNLALIHKWVRDSFPQ